MVGDILDELGQKVEAEIRAAGGEATHVDLDVTDEEQWRAAVATTVRRYGKLDILVNNAGILFGRLIELMTVEEWDRRRAINLKVVFLGTKTAIPAMRRAGGGSIINISSTAGLVGSPGETAADIATKGGVRLFTKATAIQHVKDNIRFYSCRSRPGGHRHDPRYVGKPGTVGATSATVTHGTGRHHRRHRVWGSVPRLG